MTPETIWQQALGYIRQMYAPRDFRDFYGDTEGIAYDETEHVLTVAAAAHRGRRLRRAPFCLEIAQAVGRVTGHQTTVQYLSRVEQEQAA